MKKIRSSLAFIAPQVFIALFGVLIFSCNETTAQEKVQVYGNIDYNKALPERINDYLKLESEMWKPVQEEHIRQGGITGWNVFRVWFAGTRSEYNFAVMETYKKYSDMAFVYSDDIITKVLPGINEAKLMEDTYRAREIVRAQSVERIATVEPTTKKPYQYAVVTFLAVKKDNVAAFENYVRDLIEKAYRERVQTGLDLGWDLYKMILPHGETMLCQYISFEYLSNMDQAAKTSWPGPLQGVEPCTVYRIDLWERLLYLPAE
ncbi:MAG: hypothetical protein JXB49_25150 [Bacteroidales bacterium]|nr:hypothetical protein [Bacteroidales bacterium]